MRTRPLAGVVLALLAGCGGEAPRPAQPMSEAQQQASVAVGDATARASLLPTASLDERVARGYGIERSDRHALLLVGLRRGAAAEESVPAQVEATVTDLRGRVQAVPLREIRSGDLLDYVGTVEIDPPDTLRVDLRIATQGRSATLRFTRELHPR